MIDTNISVNNNVTNTTINDNINLYRCASLVNNINYFKINQLSTIKIIKPSKIDKKVFYIKMKSKNTKVSKNI